MVHASAYLWQARVKDLENYYSDWVAKSGSPSDYRIDLVAPTSAEALTADATPEPTPTQVKLAWNAGTDALSGVAGYNIYRSNTAEAGYVLLMSTVSGVTTTDAAVSVGTDYYYRVRTMDLAGNESDSTLQASAPYILLTREVVVTAPVSGGYAGAATDAVPGATLRYLIYYNNLGFAPSTNIQVIDKVPAHTEFKLGSATGDQVISVSYSSNEGVSYNYTPAGTYVDPKVTNIRWSCDNSGSGQASLVEYSVVIR
jgi:uncharacterized repeat protein (TIGR01451 family)